jgi:hypothetical protein
MTEAEHRQRHGDGADPVDLLRALGILEEQRREMLDAAAPA